VTVALAIIGERGLKQQRDEHSSGCWSVAPAMIGGRGLKLITRLILQFGLYLLHPP
jgi:hypothetical protein